MADTDISPDFDLGISEQHAARDEQWEESAASSGNESQNVLDQPGTAEEDHGDAVGRSTQQQLEKLLNIQQRQVSVSRQASPSKPRRRRRSKRRRSPSSSSRASGRDTSQSSVEGGQRRSYIPPTKIVNIFKGEISSEKLCDLSTMKDGSPTTVRNIVPTASVSQICQMVTLWENHNTNERRSGTRQEKAKARRRTRSRSKKPRQKSSSRSKKPILDQMVDVKAKLKNVPESTLRHSGELPAPTPAQGE